jgi:hypothetical protein
MESKDFPLQDKAVASLERLYAYCSAQNWAGYDPYDALNSPFLSRFPSKWMRIAATQILRRVPFNPRKFLRIEKELNPKALALFLRALMRLEGRIKFEDADDNSRKISNWLMELNSEDALKSGTFAWGYNFPWQSRAFLCEAYAPNIQSTIMGGHALYELSKYPMLTLEVREKYQDICIKANRFILDNQLMVEDEDIAVLRYILNDDTVIINVQAQAAWSFLRAYLISKQERFVEVAEKLLKFVKQKQQRDGSWPYGEAPARRFIDNFHIGFILEALHECETIQGSGGSNEPIEKGYRFYLDRFFQKEGVVSYFHDAVYPVDSHSIAQSIITLCKLSLYDGRSGPLLENIIHWTLDNFQAQNGFFYYQKWPFFMNKISYMRWTQAWMLYALATFLDSKKTDRCVE